MGFDSDKGRAKRKRPRRSRYMLHAGNGWPHYSSFTGLCQCLDECCQDEEDGCVCRFCACRQRSKNDTSLLHQTLRERKEEKLQKEKALLRSLWAL